MLSSQVISITDLRTNTSKIVDSLRGVKYIFVNNKPKGVIMDIKYYEKMQRELKIDNMKRESDKALKDGPFYNTSEEFMRSLLEE